MTGMNNYQATQRINVCTSDKWLSPQENKRGVPAWNQHGEGGLWPQTLCTFVISDFSLWFLLCPVTPICLPGSSKKTLITGFSYPGAVYVSTPEDSIASRSQRTGQACFFYSVNRLRMKLWPINPCQGMALTRHSLHANATWLMDSASNSSRSGEEKIDGEENRQQVH